jgi:quercetin dioxygenase-like cupin family protein
MSASAGPLDFEPLPVVDGLLLDTGPERVLGVRGGARRLEAGMTHFGLVTRGVVELEGDDVRATLRGPSYFVCPDPVEVRAPGGEAVVLSARGYRGLAQLGPRLEARGRLAYIDGCTDTLLVCPPRLGEPCLNHLHIPAGTRQSSHTHPSARLGAIARGRGRCVTPRGSHALEAGLAWHIPAGVVHAFHTEAETLDVLAWHPDSDFGPRDEDHPMINRTWR